MTIASMSQMVQDSVAQGDLNDYPQQMQVSSCQCCATRPAHLFISSLQDTSDKPEEVREALDS